MAAVWQPRLVRCLLCGARSWTQHGDVPLMGWCLCPQLAFTGSTEVGKLIATETAKNVVATTLELVRHAGLAVPHDLQMQEACGSRDCLQLAIYSPHAVVSTVHCKQLTKEACMQGGKSPAIVWKVKKMRFAACFK